MKLLDDEHVICQDCLAAIPRTEHALLEQNGIDLLFLEQIQKESRTVRYERGAAFAYYNRGRGLCVRTLIERGKFGTHPNPQIFYYLGRLAAQEYIDSDLFDDVDCLVPVPLHPRRLRERGFNQAEYICKGMSEVLHIPVDNQHLIRTRNNPHQSRSQFNQRKDNVKELFSMRYPEEWKNKHILLVDDVVTSGATMFECMKQLSPIRGCRVSAFALGWAHS
jgi:ComF family protein